MAIWRKVHEFKAGCHSRLKAVGHKVNGSVETCVAKPKVFSASMTSEHVTRRGRRGWADVVSDAVLEDELNLMSDDICCVPTALSTCSDARKQHCDGPSGQVNVIAHTRDPASLPVGPALLYTYSASVAHTPAHTRGTASRPARRCGQNFGHRGQNFTNAAQIAQPD